jgi:hypothetical protein
MNDNPRPSGLTALAIINFIIAGFGAISALSRLAILSMDPSAITLPPEVQGSLQQTLESGRGYIAFAGVSGLVLTVLLVLSGIGYLKQKRMMGRTLGNAYGVLSIVARLCSMFLLVSGFGALAAITTCLGFVYPIVTLALINTVFKPNLVR